MEKEYMEKILVISRKKLFDDMFFEGFKREKITYYLGIIKKNSIFMKRSFVENDPDYKQIIPYIIIKFRNKYFMFQRLPVGLEDRLFHKYSVGIGGHINEKDLRNNKDLINSGLEREFNEELIYGRKLNYKIMGLINDDFDNVGKVHFGIVYLVEIDNPDIKIRENSRMKGRLVDKEYLLKYKDKMERWSQILVENLL